jgi:hypothetical protein
MSKWTCSEYQECKAYYAWAQYHPILREYLYKIVNEGKRSRAQGFYLQLIGMRAGLPDYHLPVANNSYHGLWIEMKTKTQKRIAKRENQLSWLDKLKKIGHYATFAYGASDAIKITLDYLNNRI